jgi:hypothetical protein
MKEYTEIVPVDSNDEAVADIDEQLQKIIKDNNSVWIIAVKSFELGQKH